MAIDLELARKLLDYDPSTGVFTWKNGQRAGTLLENGFIRIQVRGQIIYAHRLAFAFVHGYAPPHVNHKDDDRANNRADNLRGCVTQERSWRARKVTKPTTSRFKGVYWSKQKQRWHARIFIRDKHKHLGFFETEEAASAAYMKAAKQLAGEFARAF